MNKKIFIGIGIFWLLIIFGFVAVKEFTLQTGEDILLKTRPVDPRDLFRGDYVILRYDIGILNLDTLETDSTDFDDGDNIYVILRIEDGYGVVSGIFMDAPEDGLFIKGTVTHVGDDKLDIEYGIESYFVPEGEGMDIQQQSGKNLDVQVSIDIFGNAVIKSLFINDKKVRFD